MVLHALPSPYPCRESIVSHGFTGDSEKLLFNGEAIYLTNKTPTRELYSYRRVG